jgi:RHS repeat-associated protein
VLTLCLLSVQVLSAQAVAEAILTSSHPRQQFVSPIMLRDAGSSAVKPRGAVSACPFGDPDCPPPDVTITPAGGSFSTATQTVTIDWCGHDALLAATREILLGSEDVTTSFSYSTSTKAGCDSHATSTGTITLPGGTTMLTASIDDFGGQTGSDWARFTLAQNHLVSVAPHNGSNLDVSKCVANCMDITLGYATPAYTSLDQPRALTFVYHGLQANPTGTVTIDVRDTSTTKTATMISLKVLDASGTPVSNVEGRTETFFANQSGAWLRLGARFAVSSSTGASSYNAVVTSYYSNGTSASTTVPVRVLVVNERNSPYGAGWSIAGLQRLYPQSDGGMVLIDGTGTVQYYAGPCASAPCSYTSPAGEFSALSRHSWGDGTVYDRRAPDGSIVAFTSDGYEKYAQDRFGNRTSYSYTSGRLASVTDPVGQVITVSQVGTSPYGGPKLTITDPASRVTTLNLNTLNDLVSIQDAAGGTPFQGTYWSSHLVQAWNDRRGGAWSAAYDCSAHTASITAPAVMVNGVSTQPVMNYAHQDVQTTACVGSGGTSTTPAVATVRDSVRAFVTDPGGHVTSFALDALGQPLSVKDALGHTTSITRDVNGLVTQVQHPTGAVDVFRYSGPFLLMSQLAGEDSTNYHWNNALALPDSVWGPRQPWQGFVYTTAGAIQTVNTKYSQGSSPTFTSQFTTDSRGRVLTVTDPASHVTKFFYNGRFGNQDSTSMAAGQWTKTIFDVAGRDSVKSALGSPVSTTTLYDALNRVVSAYDGSHSQPFRYYYGAMSLDSLRDPMGQTFRRQVNALGWLTAEPDVDLAGGAITFNYNADGQVTSWTNRRGQTMNLTYDALHRVTSRTGPTVADSFAYSVDDRRMAAWNANSRDSLFFSATGWTDSTVARLGGQRFRQLFLHDVGQRLDSVDIAMAGGAIAFAGRKYLYDAVKNTPSTIRINGIGGASFDYDGEMFLSSIKYLMPSAQYATRTLLYTNTHQVYGDLTDLSPFGSAGISLAAGYDSLGRVRESEGGAVYRGKLYQYTPSGQLASRAGYAWFTGLSVCPKDANYGLNCASHFDLDSTNATNRFTFDDALNRQLQSDSGRTATGDIYTTSKSFSYVTGDRIGSITPLGGTLNGVAQAPSATDANSYERDLDGNITRRFNAAGTDVHYAWDEQGRLTSVTLPGPGPGLGNIVSYEYNALGQLVRRRTHGLTDRYFLWNGDDLLAELDGFATSRIAEYVYWSTDQPMAMVTGANSVADIDYFLQDQLGNDRMLVRRSSTAPITFNADYTAWGELRDTAAVASPNRLRWKGMIWEGDSTQLYYARNRWYSPKFGGFMSEDPLGPSGGANTYAFADNDPINGRDPFGLAGSFPWAGGEQGGMFGWVGILGKLKNVKVQCLNCLGISTSVQPPTTAASTGPGALRPITAQEGLAIAQAAIIVAGEYQDAGTPYVMGGGGVSGLDCIHFCRAAWSRAGFSSIPLTQSSRYAGNSHFARVPVSEARAGDLLWQPRGGGNGHVGIYLGSKNATGGLIGAEMGNSGARATSVWGLPRSEGGWFSGGDQLIVYRPMVPR